MTGSQFNEVQIIKSDLRDTTFKGVSFNKVIFRECIFGNTFFSSTDSIEFEDSNIEVNEKMLIGLGNAEVKSLIEKQSVSKFPYKEISEK